VTLRGGIAAGDYVKVGAVISPNACANLCCKDTRCDVAFMADNMCYNLHCYSAKLCQTRPARQSRFYVSVIYIKRGIGSAGRTVLDRVSNGKGNLTHANGKSNPNVTKSQTVLNSGTNLTTQKQSPVPQNNTDTRNNLPQDSTLDNKRTKIPLIHSRTDSSSVRNSTISTNSTNSANGELQEFSEDGKLGNKTLGLHTNRSTFSTEDSHNVQNTSVNETEPLNHFKHLSSHGNDSVQQENQTDKSTKMDSQAKTLNNTVSNQITVSWQNDSHILVKEYGTARTSLNGTGKVINAYPYGERGGVEKSENVSVNVSHGLPGGENSTNGSKYNFTKSLLKQYVHVINSSANENDNSTRALKFASENSTRSHHERTKNHSTNASVTEKEKLDDELLDKSFYNFNSSTGNITNHDNSSIAQLNGTGFGFASANRDGSSKDVSKAKSFSSKDKGIQLDMNTPSVSQHFSKHVRNETSLVKANDSSSETSLSVKPGKKDTSCHAGGILFNKTLIAGLKSGDFTDYGKVKGMENCVEFCCGDKICNMALMLGFTCYTLHCASPSLCKVRPAHPSSLNPRISFIFRNKPVVKSNVNVNEVQDKSGSPQTATQGKQVSKRVKGSRCKHGAIQSGVTLQSGQKAGTFKLRLKAKDMDSCLDVCCQDTTCNVAFLIDDSCYSVRCHSLEDCTIAKAKASNVHSSLSVVRSRILPFNDSEYDYIYE
jgi:hypothetical protein